MTGLMDAIRRNISTALAIALVATAVFLHLGPGWLVLGIFFGGCAYIINMALRS